MWRMSRATVQDQTFLGHQSAYPPIMRHAEHGAGGDYRPSRLLQMREDYQRRLMKEKEERMLNMYEISQKKNLERAERMAKAPPSHEEYPNSKLRQPGYMQPQPQGHQHPPSGHASSSPSVRDFFRERREIEAKGTYVPPINRHYKDNRKRTGSGHSYHKNSAGVDRANPLAPIQPRHGGINSAPAQHPFRNKPRLVKQNTISPDFDVNGHIKPNQRVSPKKPSRPVRAHPSSGTGISPKTEKLSDFQKWQMEQNKAREERLKKLNMRAPPSGRESKNWGGDYEYEEEEDAESEEADNGQEEELRRREQELLQRIAQQQEELDRLRREREEEEDLERQEAERLRKHQAAERERRRRQKQEEARQRREEEARARHEEEEQQRAARARQERQRFEAHLDLYGDSTHDDCPSQPNSHRDNLYQPNSHRENHYQPNSHRSSNNRRNSPSSVQATPKFTPKPPSEGSPRKHVQARSQPPPRRKPAASVEEHDEASVPGPGVEMYAQAIDEEQGVKLKLVSCKVCGRRFAEDRIQKHQAACKHAHKKREVMDPTQMRTDGTDMAKYIRQGAHTKEPPKKKKADWRAKHQDFISNIRYAKQMQQMEKQGVALKDLPPPPPSKADQDLVPCPHCGRTFNEQAAERHILRCQDIKTRPVGANRRRR